MAFVMDRYYGNYGHNSHYENNIRVLRTLVVGYTVETTKNGREGKGRGGKGRVGKGKTKAEQIAQSPPSRKLHCGGNLYPLKT